MITPLDRRIAEVTDRIRHRSAGTRSAYLARIDAARREGPLRGRLSCSNLAHGIAACAAVEKQELASGPQANLAIVSAYNDMLSAHQPYERYPALIKAAAGAIGAVAQFAGGVPAMCDGVTQGRAGMEMSLFSRDVVAMATGIALSHDMFDGALLLGICDKIVPGLVIGGLAFGHLPVILVPGGPMPSGLSNAEKAKIRQLAAEGKAGPAELLDAEMKAYHAPGTCTFYGTANTNQLCMELMGLHLPGASFVPPNTTLRDALTRAATERVAAITALGPDYTPMGHVVDERAVVNGVVGLLASGGSTNHTLHLVAMAAAAGITLTWEDFADLSAAVPLLARIYPNGLADVNHFHRAGGTGFLVRELLGLGLLHDDVLTVVGRGIHAYTNAPTLDGDLLAWHPAPAESGASDVLTTGDKPFQPDGGIRILRGNLGQAVIKTSAVKPAHRVVEAPARVFRSQNEFQDAFAAGRLTGDFVAVVQFQGPRANGMPELHKLTPPLGVLLDRGQKVALVTDGRMSGASGKVPAAIHVSPEAAAGGMIGRIRDGDIVRLDAEAGTLDVAADLAARPAPEVDLSANQSGTGRELFAAFRAHVGLAEHGASMFGR